MRRGKRWDVSLQRMTGGWRDMENGGYSPFPKSRLRLWLGRKTRQLAAKLEGRVD